jgi:hypothetical protein
MLLAKCCIVLACVMFDYRVGSEAADDPPTAGKKGSKAESKQEPRVLDPFDRPDGSIHLEDSQTGSISSCKAMRVKSSLN